MTRSPTIKIGRDAEYPTAFVQERFEQINSSHIEKVLGGHQHQHHPRLEHQGLSAGRSVQCPPAPRTITTPMLVNHDLHHDYGG